MRAFFDYVKLIRRTDAGGGHRLASPMHLVVARLASAVLIPLVRGEADDEQRDDHDDHEPSDRPHQDYSRRYPDDDDHRDDAEVGLAPLHFCHDSFKDEYADDRGHDPYYDPGCYSESPQIEPNQVHIVSPSVEF